MPSGTVHFDCTDPTQATTRLVIVLVSRMQRSGTGDKNFVKWKGTFRTFSDRNERIGQNEQPLEVFPNVLVGPNRDCPVHLISNQNFRNFGAERTAPIA